MPLEIIDAFLDQTPVVQAVIIGFLLTAGAGLPFVGFFPGGILFIVGLALTVAVAISA